MRKTAATTPWSGSSSTPRASQVREPQLLGGLAPQSPPPTPARGYSHTDIPTPEMHACIHTPRTWTHRDTDMQIDTHRPDPSPSEQGPWGWCGRQMRGRLAFLPPEGPGDGWGFGCRPDGVYVAPSQHPPPLSVIRLRSFTGPYRSPLSVRGDPHPAGPEAGTSQGGGFLLSLPCYPQASLFEPHMVSASIFPKEKKKNRSQRKTSPL